MFCDPTWRQRWAGRLWVPVVSGPLAPYAVGFESWLTSRAYSPKAAANRLYQFDQLSRWLEREGLGVGELTGEQAERFAAARRAVGLVTWAAPQSAMLPLGYLRSLGVAPAATPVLAQGPLDELLEDYRRYLRVERALCDHTVFDAYVPAARLFLAGWDGPLGLGLERLSRGGREFVSGGRVPEAQRVGRAGSGLRVAVVSALPAPGRVDRRAACVGGPVGRRLRDRSLPRGLDPARSRSCWPAAIGARWSAGATTRSCCCCRGWGCAPARSPRSGLTTSTGGPGCCSFAGRAAARTCCRCRSMSARRSCPIFVVVRGASVGRCSCASMAPREGLNRCTVAWVVRAACDRAGLPRVGAHRLRHTAATEMLRAGASLPRSARCCATASKRRRRIRQGRPQGAAIARAAVAAQGGVA